MKLVTSVAVLVALLLAVPAAADARKISKQDRMLAEKVVKHIVSMTTIMKKAVEKPEPALAKLEAYLERHGAAIRRLSADIEKVEQELDEDEKTKFKKAFEERPEIKAFTEAVMAFVQKHGADQALMDRFMKVFQKLTDEKENKPAEAAPPKKKAAPKKEAPAKPKAVPKKAKGD